MSRRALAWALAGLALAPATAAAQLPTPSPTPAPSPPPAAEPAPAPAPAAGKLSLKLERVIADGRRSVVLAGGRWRVRGTVSPWVPGQKATVRLYRGKRKLKARSVKIRQVGKHDRGTFTVTFGAGRPGSRSARAIHRRTAELGTLRSKSVRLSVLRARATPGARGPVVRLLQASLDRLRYAVPRSGVYDGATSRAVMAYSKVNGLRRTGTASTALLRRVLAGRGAFKVRYPKAGHHLEADLSRQVLALIDGDRVVRTYTTSTGTSATPTVLGSFRVYRKDPGTNAKGMVHSSYFIRGYAVHGYQSVPPFPASHGCLRVPIPDALTIFNWLRMGDRVFVYR